MHNFFIRLYKGTDNFIILVPKNEWLLITRKLVNEIRIAHNIYMAMQIIPQTLFIFVNKCIFVYIYIYSVKVNLEYDKCKMMKLIRFIPN